MTQKPFVVRRLTLQDAESYWEVRLRALIEHPEAFGSSPENHPDIDSIRERFAGPWSGPNTYPLGAFTDSPLVGLCVLQRPTSSKIAHTGFIYQMYVAPEIRGHGIGRALLETAIARARQWELEQLRLSVTTTNLPALTLYERLGFRTWGVESRVLKVGRRYYDFASMTLELAGEGEEG